MGNICNSPAKDIDYKDHNGVPQKRGTGNKKETVSIFSCLYSIQLIVQNVPQAKMEIIDKKEKEFSTK